jgi:outer membrane protein
VRAHFWWKSFLAWWACGGLVVANFSRAAAQDVPLPIVLRDSLPTLNLPPATPNSLPVANAPVQQEWLSPSAFIVPEVTPTPPPKSQTCQLTLEEARQRALANNKAVALARMNIGEKSWATSAATKDYYPKVLGSVTYFHFDNPLGTVLTTSGAVLPTTIPVNVVNQDAALSTAMIAQPITKLIAVSAAVRVARADEEIAQAKLDQGAKELLSGVTQVYFGLSGAMHIRDALQLQATLLDQINTSHPSADTRIGLLQVRQGQLQIQNQIQTLTDQLNDLLDLPPGTTLELADPVPPAPPVASAEQAAQMAMACNPEIREAEQDIAKAEAAMKIAHMDYYPDVNIIGGYANQTDASYIQSNFTYLGITANYTFWEWGKKNDVMRQREMDISLAHQNLQVVTDKVQLAARKSYAAFAQAFEAYQLDGEMVQACKDAERAAGNNMAALPAAKSATAKAELDYMKAEIDYRVAYAQLIAAIGRE